MILNKRHRKILDLLSTGLEMYGLDMIEASSGVLSRGTIYISLRQLEESGLIESFPEENPPSGRLARRVYRTVKKVER